MEEENAAARGDGSPEEGGDLGALVGSYRSEDDSGEVEEEEEEEEERRGEAEAPQSTPTATAARPPLPPPPQPAASPSSPPQQQQRRDEGEDRRKQQENDHLWLPASLARNRPGLSSSSKVDPALSLKVQRMLLASAAGRSLSAELRRSRAYRNPYFLEKMIDHLGLDPRASRLQPPRGYEAKKEDEEGKTSSSSSSPSFSIPEWDTADALELEEASARRAASSAVTGRVEFVRGEGGGSGGGGTGRRGRRWD